ncbi:AFR529Wp [Eremothecium gossypii ATCC 10895]|uniref:AFR529Wp n=1 Tax=Eremothecium gossypii (strain ATCC 10895 / CBS 109.51 / FGSC 9923 / NRRL Y-1056) TaxID=284811 RepID=Q752P4_EREGS|nr:AFR529Wp [Eremothecium gossypii ATCC 10895]AAS53900.1 AFR529Wp [Eremothecium gossypii ATCC 10895]
MYFSKLLSAVALCSSASALYVPGDADVNVQNKDQTPTALPEEPLNGTAYRPIMHATPSQGWMNDPNGLWYDTKEEVYHVYYQYNPADTVWGVPLYWGHLTSKDLQSWEDHGVAIRPPRNDSGAFSGSAVVDTNNTSGFFNDSIDPAQRVVAIWTYNTPESETQWISYSLDGGYTFIDYANNPVLDLNSTQFRDPKVIWHEESQKWIMTVVLSHKYAIQIYSSDNLREWTLESEFKNHGLLGFQYECPGLAKIPVSKPANCEMQLKDVSYPVKNNTDYVWVMFLAINPGGPQGGNFNQYFIGDFDGKKFTPFSEQTRFLDHGKDFYAFQGFYNSQFKDSFLGIAWASNWQYSAYVPTNPWRSSMSLARKLTVRPYNPTPESVQLVLNSEPVFVPEDMEFNSNFSSWKDLKLTSGKEEVFEFGSTPLGAFEFNLTFTANDTGLSKHSLGDFSIYLEGAKDPDEYLRLGYSTQAADFFFDRGNSKVSFVRENPFFTNKMAINMEPWEILAPGVKVFKVRAIFDVDILELFFNEGTAASTNTYFLTEENHPASLKFKTSVDNVFTVNELSLRQLTF